LHSGDLHPPEGVKKSTAIVILIPQSRERDLHCFVFKDTADASLRSA
jgi:hypothetical protein